MNWHKLYNPLVVWVLRSPLHGLMDKSQKLIHIKLDANRQPEDPETFKRFVQDMIIIQMRELVEVAA